MRRTWSPAVFLWTALRRESVPLAVGSGLFVLGTLLYLAKEARKRRRDVARDRARATNG